jgi:hypothetical protein
MISEAILKGAETRTEAQRSFVGSPVVGEPILDYPARLSGAHAFKDASARQAWALCGTVRPGLWIFSPCSAKRLRADPSRFHVAFATQWLF